MRTVIRNFASVVGVCASIGVLGCDGFLGIGDDADVHVVAEVNQADNRISVTVENRESHTIYLHHARLERREAGEWHSTLPPGWAYLDVLYSYPIEPGEDYTAERQIVVDSAARPRPVPMILSPGTYRYSLSMTTVRNANSSDMPGEVRTSNTVRIE